MAVKILVGLAGVDFALAPGDITDRFDAAEEARLIAAGYAVAIVPDKVERAVKSGPVERRGSKESNV